MFVDNDDDMIILFFSFSCYSVPSAEIRLSGEAWLVSCSCSYSYSLFLSISPIPYAEVRVL